MSQEFDREEVLKKYQTLIDSFPERVPLDTKIIYKRKMAGYEEWKIEYTAESSDTMPEPSGRRIPAYLLVPDRYKPPFPAMVCFHQCNCDCDIGKEAVVGKMINRPDQAYGFELAQQGFVVIAPDTISCGERHLPWVDVEGRYGPGINRECLFKAQFVKESKLEKYLGRTWESKVMFDARRAVDLLCSLDFVDQTRIGAIGHSMGSETTLLAMIADQRIKAGVVSGAHTDKSIALIAPRLFVEFQGSCDGTPDQIKKVENSYEFAKRVYEEKGMPENLILRILPCGHHFLDQFKWEAYYKLKQYFGMLGVKESLSLKDVLISAQEGPWSWWYWSEGDKEGFLKLPDEHYVLANKETLASAFGSLFVFLWGKCSGNSSVNVHVDSDQDNCYVVCAIPGGSDEAKSAYEPAIRKAEQFFFENSASLKRENIPDQIKYVVTLLKK